MLAGLIAALFLGFVIISIAVFSDTSIATPEEMSSFSKLPVAGIIPYIDKKSPLLLENEGCADMVDSYRRLYAHIYSDIFAETLNGKIILLTSAIPREGKSIIAANLSLVMARAGKKSLLIDFNFERPYIHKLFGIDSKSPGLTDILARGTSLDSALMSVTDMLLGNMEMGKALGSKGLDKLNIIIAGRPLSMAGELLHSDKIEKLLQDLKNRFDIIILDGPSVSESVDGIILASKCDAALMAYSAGKKPTPRSYLKSAINSLAKSGSLKGVIITRCI